MINLVSYGDHDVDEDPIIVLPCGHFFTASTLDGVLSISSVYTRNQSGEFTGLRSLKEAGISDRPIVCPTCRKTIHSIHRYGRVSRFAEIRALERKHMMRVDKSLDQIASQSGAKAIKRLERIEKEIVQSPMRRIYEACQGNLDDVPVPPARPRIRLLELMGRAHVEMVKKTNDNSYEQAMNCFRSAIDIATTSESHFSNATIRLKIVGLMIRWTQQPGTGLCPEGNSHIEWVLAREDIFPNLAAEARELKKKAEDTTQEVAEVVKAMGVIAGYNYGTSWSSHWYECPNGHPYFIGECGGAMEQAQCIECGAVVGGQGHRLNATNRAAGGLVGAVLARGRTG